MYLWSPRRLLPHSIREVNSSGYRLGDIEYQRMSGAPAVSHISALVGVYNADGTRRGELAYLVGAHLGRSSCALCNITHSTRSLRERSEWRTCRAALRVPFQTYHRNDQPAAIRAATRDTAPAVVAITNNGVVPLLGLDELHECQGSTEQLVRAVESAVERLGLAWPSS